MAERARLESVFTVTRNGGSNPPLSAKDRVSEQNENEEFFRSHTHSHTEKVGCISSQEITPVIPLSERQSE